jgi:hypothetical protein
MGACSCGYTTDPEKNCNGTHNVVKAVKADLIAKLEAEDFADAAEHLKNNKSPSKTVILTIFLFNLE